MVTYQFPKNEQYGLSLQMRRASCSIVSNIAEGCGRNSNPQLTHFFQLASGSASELQYQVILCRDLTYLSDPDFKERYDVIITIRKMLFAYSAKLKAESQ